MSEVSRKALEIPLQSSASPAPQHNSLDQVFLTLRTQIQDTTLRGPGIELKKSLNSGGGGQHHYFHRTSAVWGGLPQPHGESLSWKEGQTQSANYQLRACCKSQGPPWRQLKSLSTSAAISRPRWKSDPRSNGQDCQFTKTLNWQSWWSSYASLRALKGKGEPWDMVDWVGAVDNLEPVNE